MSLNKSVKEKKKYVRASVYFEKRVDETHFPLHDADLVNELGDLDSVHLLERVIDL